MALAYADEYDDLDEGHLDHVRHRHGLGFGGDIDDDDDDHNSEIVPNGATIKMINLESEYEEIAEDLKKLSDEMKFVFYKMERSLLEENHLKYLNNVKNTQIA